LPLIGTELLTKNLNQMKVKNFLLALLLAISLKAFPQATPVYPNLDYTVTPILVSGSDATGLNTVVDYVNSYVYTCGYVWVSGQKDMFVTKFDYNGNIIWTAQYDYASLEDKATAVTVDGSGNVYICGASQQAAGNSDAVVLKYDASGSLQWVARHNGTNNTNDLCNSLVFDGSYIWACGYSTTTSKGKDFLTLRVNASTGSIVNANKKNGTANSDEEAKKLTLLGTNLFITGSINNTSTNTDIFTMCLNVSSATITWTSVVDGTASGADCGNDIKAIGSNVIVVGNSNNTTTGDDYQILCLSASTGSTSFSYSYDGGNNGVDIASSVALDKSGNYAVTGLITNGSSNNEIHTQLYSSANSLLWTNTQPMNGAFTTNYPKVATDTILSYVYVAGTYSNTTLDAFLYQIDPATGTQTWNKKYDAGYKDINTDIVLDGVGRVYLSSVQETSTANIYAVTMMRYSQTPIYPPIDSLYEEPNNKWLFNPNMGQLWKRGGALENSVAFMNTEVYPLTYISTNRISYVLYNDSTTTDTIQKIDVNILGSKTNTEPYPSDPFGGLINICHDSLPDAVIDIPCYRRYMIPNIYNGIDLHYYSNQDGMKLYFVVKPFYEADPNDIKLAIDGANSTAIVGTDLEITGFNSKITFDAPYAYQVDMSANIIPLASSTWTSLGTNTFAVATSTYDTSLPLIYEFDYGNSSASIAAYLNILYCSFYGSAVDDGIRAIDVDKNTGDFVALFELGASGSGFPFPTVSGQTISFNTAVNPGTQGNCFAVVLFDKDGIRKSANTYGLNIWPVTPMGVTLHNNLVTVIGNAPNYTGTLPVYTSTGPLTTGAYSNNNGPGFVLQFAQDLSNGSLNQIKWRSFLNGYASDITKTPDGNDLYITTATDPSLHSPDLLSETGAYNNSSFVTSLPHFQISKFDSVGIRKWATIYQAVNTSYQQVHKFNFWNNVADLGLKEDNYLKCRITCDNYGFSIAGETDTTGLFTFSRYGTALDNTHNGKTDGFFARFNKQDSIVYSTYIGSSEHEAYLDICNSGLKESVLVGYSNSQNMQKITTLPAAGYMDSTITNSNAKILITKFDTIGNKTWSTYFGASGSNKDVFGMSVAEDNLGKIYVTGRDLGGFTFPATNPSGVWSNTVRTNTESYMLAFDWNQPIWNTRFGGYYEDVGTTLAYNPKKNGLILGGLTNSSIYASPAFPAIVNYIPTGVWDQQGLNGAFSATNEYDGFISIFATSSIIGIEEYFKDKTANELFDLFPNPAQNNVNIAFKNEIKGNVKIEIYNQLGQLISLDTKRNILPHTILSIQTSGLAEGMYVVNVSNELESTSKKLIVYK
jgi:hypothetical protein